MRRKEFIACASRDEARLASPWASAVVRVEGGYIAFEDKADYHEWVKQNQPPRKPEPFDE